MLKINTTFFFVSHGGDEEEIPDEFLGPITHELLEGECVYVFSV